MKITDTKIILASLSFSLFSLSFFLYYTPERKANDVFVVGKFLKVQKDVKRKSESSIDWEPVVTNDEVRGNDLVFTGAQSFAKIAYLTKALTIIIPPNSIIKIEMVNNKPTFDVESGSVVMEVRERIFFNLKVHGEVKVLPNTNKPMSINVPSKGKVTFIEAQKPAGRAGVNAKAQEPVFIDLEEQIRKQADMPNVVDEAPNYEYFNKKKKEDEKFSFYVLIATSLIIFISSFLG